MVAIAVEHYYFAGHHGQVSSFGALVAFLQSIDTSACLSQCFPGVHSPAPLFVLTDSRSLRLPHLRWRRFSPGVPLVLALGDSV